MMKIALDAMGGDHAPDVVVEGAISAVSSNDGAFGIVLTGPKDIITV
jgi:glycerol-3-phosphate acyltransferase PlsX